MPSLAAPALLAARLVGRPRRRHEARERAAALLGVGALAGTAFGALAAASARRTTVAPDNRVHDRMVEKLDGPTGEAAETVAPVVEQGGKWWVYGSVAVVAAAAVLTAPRRAGGTARARGAGAAAIAVVPALATALSPAFDRWLPQPPVGPRQRPLDHPVFPSGHAFRAAAVALAAGYVVTRERLAHPGVVWPLAAAGPTIVGVGRLVREKHLASDVMGGLLAGVTLAAAAAGAYELAREPRRGPRRRPGRA